MINSYIHGGAWRDPLITSSSFNPARDILLNTSLPLQGLASINYRLSPYPSHPTHPSSPDDDSRNAKHPDHLTDVLSALEYLHEHYIFDNKYIIVGHSCGATLALQACASLTAATVPPPLAAACVEGIYDMPGLVSHNSHPA